MTAIRNTLVSEVLSGEKILDGGYVTGLDIQEREALLTKIECKRTVIDFIGEFKALILELCGFDHERADRLRIFTGCQFFGKNVACGHPRVIRAKFKIAHTLLLIMGTITKAEFDEYEKQVYRYTEPLTGYDFRATAGYKKEYQSGGIQNDSPTEVAMKSAQKELGTKLITLRDALVQKLEATFLN